VRCVWCSACGLALPRPVRRAMPTPALCAMDARRHACTAPRDARAAPRHARLPQVSSINLAGLDRVMLAVAGGPSERSLLLRQYRIAYKRSGTKVAVWRACLARGGRGWGAGRAPRAARAQSPACARPLRTPARANTRTHTHPNNTGAACRADGDGPAAGLRAAARAAAAGRPGKGGPQAAQADQEKGAWRWGGGTRPACGCVHVASRFACQPACTRMCVHTHA
jgi:hypothetical protein